VVISLEEHDLALTRLAVAVAADPPSVAVRALDALAHGASALEVESVARTAALDQGALPVELPAEVAAAGLRPWTERADVDVRGYTSTVARRRGTSRVPLVLCHSLGTDHRLWEPLVAALPPHVDVIAYDVRNHGPERAVATDFTVPTAVDDLVWLLDRLEVREFYLAGISMGGFIAQEFAVQQRERLVGLSLMATRGKGARTGEERAAAGERDGIASQLAVTLSRWFSPGYLALNGPEVRHVRRLLLNWNVEAWARGWRAIGSANAVGRLALSTVPTLCIAGETDASSPPHVLQAIADVLPNASMQVVPGPHLFPVEQPRAVAALLTDHLDAVCAQVP
jgi:3-oxoadipate enol-lactonase